jgi:hypothetical protein
MPSNFLSISYINGQVVSTGAITGTLAATEAQDTISASGTVSHTAITITGSLAATEAQDTAALAGDLAHVGIMVVTESADGFSALGKLAHVGTLAATDGQDIFEATGGGLSAFTPPPALFIVNMGRMMGR